MTVTFPVRPCGVESHRGSYDKLVERHRQEVRRAVESGPEAIAELVPRLFDRIADFRTLRVAWNHLVAHGGHAPGPDGVRYGDLAALDIWPFLRSLAKSIRDESYRPGRERYLEIPKESGSGVRKISLRNIADRVVERAVVEILQPLLDPQFSVHSFGARPGLGPISALGAAYFYASKQNPLILIAEDLKDAFEHVPLERLHDVLKKRLPRGRKTLNLIKKLTRKPKAKGLRQGSPLSSLLMNVYLDHFLDKPWQRESPGSPLLRYVDDLLIICNSTKDADQVYRRLQKVLLPTGMKLKGTAEQSTHDLAGGATVRWLGFDLSLGTKGMTARLDLDGENGWLARLRAKLILTHERPDSSQRAIDTINGMTEFAGPCWDRIDQNRAYEGIRATAAECGFEEIGSRQDFGVRCEAAQNRWLWVKKRTRKLLKRTQKRRHSLV